MNYLKNRLAERDTKLGLANVGLSALAVLFPEHTVLAQVLAGALNTYFVATPSVKK